MKRRTSPLSRCEPPPCEGETTSGYVVTTISRRHLSVREEPLFCRCLQAPDRHWECSLSQSSSEEMESYYVGDSSCGQWASGYWNRPTVCQYPGLRQSQLSRRGTGCLDYVSTLDILIRSRLGASPHPSPASRRLWWPCWWPWNIVGLGAIGWKLLRPSYQGRPSWRVHELQGHPHTLRFKECSSGVLRLMILEVVGHELLVIGRF